MCYLAGAVLVLALKLLFYVYNSSKFGKKWHQSLAEWFFEKSGNNAVSWVATIGIVWLIGSAYIDRIGLDWILGEHLQEKLQELPVINSMAFVLGCFAEYLAPSALKKLMNRFQNKKGETA